jgi:hypothetical protein
MTRLGRTRDRRKSDQFAQPFSVAGEKQKKVVDEATASLLKKLSLDSDIEKAKAAFDHTQSVEEKFHRDFDGSISRIDRACAILRTG